MLSEEEVCKLHPCLSLLFCEVSPVLRMPLHPPEEAQVGPLGAVELQPGEGVCPLQHEQHGHGWWHDYLKGLWA